MGSWLAPALLSLMGFGLWGLFTKLSVNHIDSKSAFVYQSVGVIMAGFLVFWLMDFKAATNTKGILFSLLTGVAYGLGCLFYFYAASRGNIINVVTLTALYPLVTIVLAYLILHETISPRQGLGVIFALTAVVLFAG